MHIFSKNSFQHAGLFALLPFLGACSSIAPGMHFNARNASVPASRETVPIIKSITPQLVLEERLQRNKQVSQEVRKLSLPFRPYTIDSGDVLSIVVWDHPELASTTTTAAAATAIGSPDAGGTPTNGFVVDHLGSVQFPYAGMIKLRGLTEEQARRQLSTRLGRYIRNPNITLRVQSYRSKRVYIDGDVKSPGQQAINDIPMTLVEAINRAGGVLATADQSQISIIRGGKSYKVDLLRLAQQGINPTDIKLAHGDIVRVQSRNENKVFVSGEVITPKALPMHNGRMTLNEALGEAGGINPNTGDGSQVYVIRNSGGKQPIVYHLNARSPTALATAEEFELRPKDVVYVDATQLATWSRVVNLILPSAVSGAVSSAATLRAVK